MKNKEKFHDEIFRIACLGTKVALVGGEPAYCSETRCDQCDLNLAGCASEFEKWCESEYVEPKPKLTKRERDFIDCIAADFHLIREVDGSIALLTCGFVLELDEGLFPFIAKVTSKKELLQMEVEE